MGSPVSVVVANLFMEEVEEKALQSFAHPVRTWKRYVDDTFVVIDKGHVDALHEHLNRQAAGVIFTVERERMAGSSPSWTSKSKGFKTVRSRRRYIGRPPILTTI